MDRQTIRLATKLLLKAETTSSDHESAALALRSYSLLARTIDAYEASASPGERGRERRLLHDRRAAGRAELPGPRHDAAGAAAAPPGRVTAAARAAAYSGFAAVEHTPRQLDCVL